MDFASGFLPIRFEAIVFCAILDSYSHLIHVFSISVFPHLLRFYDDDDDNNNKIPVIIGATGTISKSIIQYLSNIPGKHEIKEMQKQPFWALHTILRKVLM